MDTSSLERKHQEAPLTKLPLNTSSQPDRASELSSLSQPSHSGSNDNTVKDRDGQSLSQPSADSMCRKRGIPWKIDLPESFYASRKRQSKERVSPSAEFPGNGGSLELQVPTGTKSFKTKPERSPSMPPPHYQLPWRPQSTEAGTTVAVDKKSPAKPSPKIAHSKISSGTPLKSQATTSHYPNTKPTDATKTTPRCTDSFAPDQSVPNSPGGNSNFSIVFSEGEDEGEGVRKDEMISSQMDRQIKKVTTFLKMDRLRRTKIPKL